MRHFVAPPGETHFVFPGTGGNDVAGTYKWKLPAGLRVHLRSVDLSLAKVVPWGAFHSCRALRVVALSPDLVRIEEQAFRNCESLEGVDLLGCPHLESVGPESFRGCFSLRSLAFPPGLPYLGLTGVGLEEADLRWTRVTWARFEECPRLRKIVQPRGAVTPACRACPALVSVTFGAPLEEWADFGLELAGPLELRGLSPCSETEERGPVLGGTAFAESGTSAGIACRPSLPL